MTLETVSRNLGVDGDAALRHYRRLAAENGFENRKRFKDELVLSTVGARLRMMGHDLSKLKLRKSVGEGESARIFSLSFMFQDWGYSHGDMREALLMALIRSDDRVVTEAFHKDVRFLTRDDLQAIAKERNGGCLLLVLDILAIRAFAEARYSSDPALEADRGQAGEDVVKLTRYMKMTKEPRF